MEGEGGVERSRMIIVLAAVAVEVRLSALCAQSERSQVEFVRLDGGGIAGCLP
jgi:hypothetical protein